MTPLALVRDRPMRLVVVGAPAGTLRSTVALNLAVAAAAAGIATLLLDLDGASSRALAPAVAGGCDAALPWLAAPLRVGAAGGGVDTAVAPGLRTLVVVDLAPRLDDVARAELAAASDVLVPMDASAVARRALREVVAGCAAVATPPRLHVALARSLPRDVDRWALLAEIEALAPEALLSITLPAGRPVRATGSRDGPPVARLYAPATRAAEAYGALVRALGLASLRVVPS